MPVLPRVIPDAERRELATALAAGITLGDRKPGTAVTLLAEHAGATWELTYMGRRYGWRAAGPGAEHGVGVFPEDAADLITTERPEPAPEPADPCPDVPRTHLGFTVPDTVRRAWRSELGDGWRLGIACAVGRLPANRIR
ncbi:hypothetical protein B0E38_01794 [Streptomyces sp. 111WW2]|uniref:hypothetical protein n=1 Tax=Streptomyces sp. 111WW2 TaxID=1945515 RepID=UPI000D0C76BC|nr:hypothetical protein [Streptomyces sp. 111WW2]PSK57949.1 hypothetical protein B0E38_01794 [Streptomyces sp. 111WW2]